MTAASLRRSRARFAVVLALASGAPAQKTDAEPRFHVIGDTTRRPPGGLGVLLVLPGGDGGADFRGFVEQLAALVPEDMVVVQMVAPDWSGKESVVWPTRADAAQKLPSVVEDLAASALAQVAAKAPIDKKRVYTLSWSSGGPAAYALSLDPKLGIRGSLVVMSVFHSDQLGKLTAAKGRAYYLLQSPDDTRCKLAFAETARDVLAKHGAVTRLVTYAGGHAWNAEAIAQVGFGLRWLDRQLGYASAPAAGTELLANGSFEQKLEGWKTELRSGRSQVTADAKEPGEGKLALRVEKKGAMPPDLVTQEVAVPDATRELVFEAKVACEGAANAWVKVFVTDAAGKDLVTDVDAVRVAGTAEWERFTKRWTLPAGQGRRARVVMMMVGDGVVRVDAVRLVDVRAR